uniref:Uncharacterized protein n=1 Tax=Anopheles atroparvus TaxID=41427 RepID=A0AAG5CZD0_ANOAO
MALISYKTEIAARKYIAENIGHAISTDFLGLFVCSWNNMMDTERSRELRIKMITDEFQIHE